MNHAGYKDLLALEALHSLDEADAALLREHPATCDECQRELIEWRDAAALLAFSVDGMTPPETLRARILASLKETNGETIANAETHGSEEAGKVLPLRSAKNASVAKVSANNSVFWRSAIAASIIAALLIISLIVFRQRNNARQEERARLSIRNNEKQPESNQSSPRNDETTTESVPSSNNNDEAPPDNNRSPTRNDNNNRQEKKTGQAGQRKASPPSANQSQATGLPVAEAPVINSNVTGPTAPAIEAIDTRIVQLAGTSKAPQAHARMVFDRSAGNITVSVSDLPPPAAGKTYQLWFIVKGHPIPGSVFVTGQEGRAMIRGQIPVRARAASRFAITLEKSNGANKPSGDKYLLGSITAS